MVRNIVFDVGGVLLRLRYQPFIDYLASAGVDLSDLPTWLATVDLAAHERGEISGQELLGRIAATAPRPLDRAELEARWLDMFERWDEMFTLARGLMPDYRVYLLSNIGDLHWAHIDERYGVGQLVHGACASFRVGAVKPDPRIYRAAERLFDLDPAATVFIDDLAGNVAGARECGWQAIHHSDARETRDRLRAFGVRLPGPFAEER
ncbi:MAG TPA: HAD family phosphatase [Steroidobacteraceae bacterium]|nr:HAD family phosphatase [Steroidobacteraceae bacterium]